MSLTNPTILALFFLFLGSGGLAIAAAILLRR